MPGIGKRGGFLVVVAAVSLAGCGGNPSKVNIQLRKEIDSLHAKIADLQRRHDVDRATIAVLESKTGTNPYLPQDRLDRLFTTAGIRTLQLTRLVDADPDSPGFEAFKVSFTPFDQTGDDFKASGSAEIIVKDGETDLDRWQIDTAELNSHWLSSLVFDGFVVERPLSSAKAGGLTVVVRFTDELTGRQFEASAPLRVPDSGSK